VVLGSALFMVLFVVFLLALRIPEVTAMLARLRKPAKLSPAKP
jgi:hypothetical protein